MGRRSLLLAAAGILALAGGGAQATTPSLQQTVAKSPKRPTSFRTPSRNIACIYVPAGAGLGPTSLRCDILSGLKPEPRGDCELDWTGLSLGLTGPGRPTCAGDTVYDPRSPVIGYGRTWKKGGFTCVSQKSGLWCANRGGHGFFLSRERWRVF